MGIKRWAWVRGYNCATEVSSGGSVRIDIKHRINNLSHSSEWNMQDISLSGCIFIHLRLMKIWPPAHEISRQCFMDNAFKKELVPVRRLTT